MSFDKGLDIDAMFADAASAAENTGEEDYNTDPEITELDQYQNKKNEEINVTKETNKDNNVVQSQKTEDIEDVIEEVELNQNVESSEDNVSYQEENNEKEDNIVNQDNISQHNTSTSSYNEPPITQPEINYNISTETNSNMTQVVDINAINKIIEMKKILDAYNKTELEFVEGYFQKEKGTSAEIIYAALTVEEKELSALNNIVTARKHTAAERAFYLMDLDNGSIESIYEQIELLTGELGELQRVDDFNKISICRKLESSISTMPADVFTYISKLQEFTSEALKK